MNKQKLELRLVDNMKKKKVSNKKILEGRREALKNALDKGYITQEEYNKNVNKPLNPKKKKVKNPRAIIFGGLNTNSM